MRTWPTLLLLCSALAACGAETDENDRAPAPVADACIAGHCGGWGVIVDDALVFPHGRIPLRGVEMGNVDDVTRRQGRLVVNGWAASPSQHDQPAPWVALFMNAKLVATVSPRGHRPDLESVGPALTRAGFTIDLPEEMLEPSDRLRVFSLDESIGAELPYSDAVNVAVGADRPAAITDSVPCDYEGLELGPEGVRCLVLPVDGDASGGVVERLERDDAGLAIDGWAAASDDFMALTADEVLVFAAGRIIGRARPELVRPDVTNQGADAMAPPGFELHVAEADLPDAGSELRVVGRFDGSILHLADASGSRVLALPPAPER